MKKLFNCASIRSIWHKLFVLSLVICYSHHTLAETYTLSVGESVNISQSAQNGGYIDNVGLADYLDAHLGFSKNSDGSAKITVKSYFDYTATVQLVFIERYQSYYSGRYHTRAATYYKTVYIKCNYEAPQPTAKPTKVTLPERVRVFLDKRTDIVPILEPYGAKGTDYSWGQSQGTAVFSHGQYDNGNYYVIGRSTGLGKVWVKIDNDDELRAETIIEVVDPDFLPPTAVFLPSSIEISVGRHATLEPIIEPTNASTSYTWTSDNSSVATVSYGKVSGIKVGTTTITVKTANELTSTCTVTVVSANGKDDENEDDNPTTGSIDGHEYVDLGLSVKWATTNLGAEKPEDYGNYYAWGETTTKSSYSWSNYKYGSGVSNCTNIGSDIGETQYDAANVNWGSNWRMPTKTEFSELISKCQFKPHSQNGVNGYLITGPNGNTIFLPIAGVKRSDVSTECRYWSSSAYNDYQGNALLVTTKSGVAHPSTMEQMRFIGIPIRAVTLGNVPFVGVIAAYSTWDHSLVIKADGTLWACGNNDYGQLCNGKTTELHKFTKVLDDVSNVAVGSENSRVIKKDGTLWVCGSNSYGQLCDGTKTNRSKLKKVMENVSFITGGLVSLFIKTDGSLWGCGNNKDGVLGNGTGDGTTNNVITPFKIMENVSFVSTNSHSLIIKKDGSLWGCGNNSYKQLSNESNKYITTPFKMMDNVVSAAAGYGHTLVVKKDGTLWVRGSNTYGQLGDGTTTDQTSFTQIMDDVLFVTANNISSYIIKKDGSLWACGNNDQGQLGDGTTANRKKPVKIMDDVLSVSSGGQSTLIVKKDGSLWACGSNGYGQLGDGTTTKNYSPIEIMEGSTTAIKEIKLERDWDNQSKVHKIFNLSGQQLAAPQKGVNIINGKKYVVK